MDLDDDHPDREVAVEKDDDGAWRDHQKLEPQVVREIVEIYRQARDLIFVAGFDVAYLDAEIKMVKQGQPPPWRRPGWRRADLDDTASVLPG